MIVVTVFLSILNQMDFLLVQNRMGYDRGASFPFNFEPNGLPFSSENRKENCHHGHIPFNVKGNRNIVFSVHTKKHGLRSTSEL